MSWSIHLWSIISICQKIELSWGNDAKLKDQIWSNRVMVNTPVKYDYCIPKMELFCWKDAKLKDQIWPCPLIFHPKINRGHPQVKVNIYVKYHHCMSNCRGFIVQKTFFHRQTDRQMDRQTAMVKPVYLHNFVGGGYTNLFSIWRNRWKMTPLEVQISWGIHFFTTFGPKFNVKMFTRVSF